MPMTEFSRRTLHLPATAEAARADGVIVLQEWWDSTRRSAASRIASRRWLHGARADLYHGA